MGSHARRLAVGLMIVVSGAAAPRPDDDGLSMTDAVACKAIRGFEDYDVLPDAELPKEAKLQVYYQPLHYKVERTKDGFRVHLAQSGRIRRRGEKAVLWKKDDLLDFEMKTERPPGWLCLRNSIAIQGLKPGDYDLDIILRDKLKPGAEATQVLKFRVIPSPPPPPEDEPKAPGESGKREP